MILSASRRTDIPAFYGDWFINRIKAGYFISVNPMNIKQKKVVNIKSDNIDAIVFWTKYPIPFFKHIQLIEDMGYNFYFQFTLNNYPKIFEPNILNIEKRVDAFKRLSNRIGREKVIWRYDPIILSNITPIDYHIENIINISNELKDYTCRLVISFLDFYGKIKSRMNALEKSNNILIDDILNDNHSIEFLSKSIKNVCFENNYEVFTCAEQVDLSDYGIQHGSCIDGKLINKIFNKNTNFKKDPRQRKECCCVESIDIGMYNTCRFQCEYCYANYSSSSIGKNIAKHCDNSSTLIGDCEDENIKKFLSEEQQMNLF